MDRIDAMVAFVAVAEAGGFSLAARKLARSPASITRAVAFVEARTGVTLLRRTTRVVKLTEAGERYLVACRQILAELEDAESLDATERATPRGLLTVTAPSVFGRVHVLPVVASFLSENPEARARLMTIDRVVSLIDEGVDVAIRIAHLADSALVATKLGEVRRVLCASPAYLSKRSKLKFPADLTSHACISFSQVTPQDVWTFKGRPGEHARQVKIQPSLTVNAADTAIDAALDGHGITRVLSYQVDRELREGRLVHVLPSLEPEPLPVHIVYAAASGSNAKVRAFVELAVPRLRAALSRRR